MARRRILVVDDEAGVRRTLSEVLQDEGFEVAVAEEGTSALESVRAEPPAVVLLDIWMPGRDGLEILPEIRRIAPGTEVIMISGHGTIETAVRATKLGAFDFVEKPLSLEKILVTVRNALRQGRLLEKKKVLTEQLVGDEELIGECAPIQELRGQILRAAPSTARVLILGENGTGKELVARMLHRHSLRKDEAFIEVNCAALPEELIESELFGHVKGAFTGASEGKKGKFELADEGTLLLDEVGDMSLRVQAKVLRVLQEQAFESVGGSRQIRVDVRVLAATNKDLESEIAAGRFREDLYFRLNVIPLRVPPLRDRGRDVLLLARYFCEKLSHRYGRPTLVLAPEAEAALLAYSWPGNVREIHNLVERLAILVDGDRVEVRHLPAALRAAATDGADTGEAATLKDGREAFERQFILRRIRECGGNISRAAEILGIERSSLYRKLRHYGLRPEEPAEKP